MREIPICEKKEDIKKKEVDVGITEELKNFLMDWTDKITEEKEEKKYSDEVKIAIVEIAKREIDKIDGELTKKYLKDDEWFKLIEKIDKISDLVRWY